MLPDGRNYPGAYNGLASVLSTSPDDDIRDGKRAIEYAVNACRFTEYNDASCLDTLAAAYAETGQFAEAVKSSEKAIQLNKDDAVRDELQQHLDAFRNHRPWREGKIAPEIAAGDAALREAIQPRIDFQRGLELARDGKSDEAATLLNKVLDKFSTPVDPWVRNDLPNDDTVQSDELYNKLASLRPNDRVLRLARAKYLGSNGRWKELAEILSKVIEADPADWRGLCQLAVVQLYLGDLANYRRSRQDLIKRFGDTITPEIANGVAMTCLLTTQDQDDLRLSEHVENATVETESTNDCFMPEMH